MATKQATGTSYSTAGGTVALGDGGKQVRGTCGLTAAGSLGLTVGNRRQASCTCALTAAGNPGFTLRTEGRGTALARVTSGFRLGFALSGSGKAQSRAAGTLGFTLDGEGLTVQQCVLAVLDLFGVSKCGHCSDAAIITQLNACLQLIYSRAHLLEYFNRKPITVTVNANADNVALPQNVQNLLGPPRDQTTKRPLAACPSKNVLDRFADLYLGYTPAAPAAYFLDSAGQDEPDSVGLTLYVSPAPSADATFVLDVSLEPPRYTEADIAAGTALQIPHRFAELLLLPLLRKWAIGSRFYVTKQQQPQIDEQYAAAMAALGMVEPETPTMRKARSDAFQDVPSPRK